MTEYGKGSVLGAAAVLPATSALAIMLINNLQPWLLVGFIVINVVWLLFVAASITRFLLNRRIS